MTETEDPVPLRDRLANGAFLALMGLVRVLPYRLRIPAMGWFFAHVLGPLAGWRGRIRDNLAKARPDLSPAEVRRLCRAVPDNAGRALAEIYSGEEFTTRIHQADPLAGPGLPALEQAADAGRPVILAVAHFGNYDAMRAALTGRGWPVGALYRPMNNEAFNRHYIPPCRPSPSPCSRAGGPGIWLKISAVSLRSSTASASAPSATVRGGSGGRTASSSRLISCATATVARTSAKICVNRELGTSCAGGRSCPGAGFAGVWLSGAPPWV